LIDTIKPIGKNQPSYTVNKDNKGIVFEQSLFSSSELDSLWKNEDYKTMLKDSTLKYLHVTTQSFVGCPSDNYQLYLVFKDIKAGSTKGYFLYFYPVEYKSFSR
jgi:hypothetical protein